MSRPKVVFLVNAPRDNPMGTRAREFASRLATSYEIAIAYRETSRARAIAVFFQVLRSERPAVAYVLDVGYSGIVAALAYKLLTRTKLVVDTGDPIYALARSAGLRRPLGLAMTGALEWVALRAADRIVVRGTKFRTYLATRGLSAVVVQDGIDTKTFGPASVGVADLRARLGLEGVLSVGFTGSLIWSPRLQMGYGWDLVEAMRLLRGEPVKGVLIGGGTAVPILKARAAAYGLGDQMLFVDPVPFADLPPYLSAIDVWLWTQTNDIVGNARTTGKLPVYLAAGCYILATDVGEASLVLDREMLVEYHGVVDHDYPSRLAERLRGLIGDRTRLVAGRRGIQIAREQFDYDVLAPRVGAVLASVIDVPRHAGDARA